MRSLRLTSCAVLAVLIVGLFATSAAAARIPLVTATTNMGSGFGTQLINTVNGVGLNALTLNALHAPSAPGNSWVSLAPTTTGQVTFDLGGMWLVDGFSFWNQNAGGPGALGSTGINRVNVLFSTNGALFLPIPGAPVNFAQVMTGANSPPQMFAFAPLDATHIRFEILSNHGDLAQTGFAEVGFSAQESPIPEPATGLLILAGLVALRKAHRAI